LTGYEIRNGMENFQQLAVGAVSAQNSMQALQNIHFQHSHFTDPAQLEPHIKIITLKPLHILLLFI
jgi:hypothetical protein